MTRYYFHRTKGTPEFFDTYILNIETKTEECILECNDVHPFVSSGWSRNERYVLYQKFYSNSDQDILIYDTTSKSLLNITEHKGSMKNMNCTFSRKADTVYFLSDYEREFTAIAFYKVKSGEIGWHILDKWDITGFIFSRSEKYLLYSTNENGEAKLKLQNNKTGKTRILKLPKGNCLGFEFTPDEKKIIIIFDSPQNPNDIYVYDIKKEKIQADHFFNDRRNSKKRFCHSK